MAREDSIVSFTDVTFEYAHNKLILDESNFNIRRGSKITVMGQNGAGKSTIFALITGALKPESGQINLFTGLSIALSRQVIPRDELDLTVREFFAHFAKASAGQVQVWDIDKRIDEVLEIVNLKGHEKVHERIIKSFSGGQQARLLLASALIQDPDLLLLDEPTNNLDKAGIEHLTGFLQNYKKSVVVISHDAEFLKSFTDGVLYLDIFTRKIEQYVGNYFDVVREIEIRREKENSKNARLAKEIQENKDKSNFFANKGGQMRMVAKRMREKANQMEEEMVDVRREDKTIRAFTIPNQDNVTGEAINISSVTVLIRAKKTGVLKQSNKRVKINLKKGEHLLLAGPNGIGKSTLLENIANNRAGGVQICEGVKVGYYRQDFSNLDFEKTVYQELQSAMMPKFDEEKMRSTASGFLINGDMMRSKIGSLSEGQKGLVAFARLVLEAPGLLILDEPTNHINFRHLPIIATALDQYKGAMILVSHVPDFVNQIKIDETMDLAK